MSANPKVPPRRSRLPVWPPPASTNEDDSPPIDAKPRVDRELKPPPSPRELKSSPKIPHPSPRAERVPHSPLPTEPQLPPRPIKAERDSSSPVHVPASASPRSPRSPQSPQASEGFGVCLQNCYDAIHKRHEEELKALESLRVHIFNRAKADKEYAETLAKANSRASRGIANLTQTSAIVEAWSCFLEVSENIQKQVASGSAQLSSVLLQRVDQLIRDKRGAKKVFDAERTRVDDEYHASSNDVQNLRRDYRRYLQVTEADKRKVEANLAKENAKQTEIEKYRKRFVAHADKLHTCHNNYTLSVLNANAHQYHYRDSLVPFSLDTLQHRMELQISEWKDVMVKYAQAVDLTQVYEQSFQRLYNAFRQVEKEEEYVEFIRENKKEQPPIEYFEFDTALLQNYCSPQVHPGKVVVNNLTHNTIKTRLANLESELEQHQKDITEKEQEMQELLSSPEEENGLASPLSPTSLKNTGAQLPRHVLLSSLKSDIRELESKQARKTDQVAVIKEAVDTLGDAPPSLFDPLGEGVDVKDLEVASLSLGASAATPGKRGRLASTLKHGLKGMKGILKKKGKKKDRTPSISESSEFPQSPSGDVLDEEEEMEDKGHESGSDTSSTYDLPPEIPVEEEDWFFGDIDRKLSESKCKNNGDYLVRYSARQNKYVLTCNWNGQGKHFVIQAITDEQGHTRYRFESKAFPTIRELLDYHVTYGTPVTRTSGAIIVKYVTKYDKWALRHDDVQRGKKIGKGCFGEVFEGKLTTTGQKVAVKTCKSETVQDLDKFLKEAEILKLYDHPNIVRLIGVCAEKEPVYIIMELMPGGAFLDYLRKKGVHQTKRKLCEMVVDASCGMEYLESKNCIHRDLAARNCLVAEDDSLKISDFGMSREEEGGIYMVSSGTRQIPIKWTAPEALNYGKYTTSSDVWSFGVLLWEAFSCGSSPYPGMSNQEARTQVEVGYRMSAPADCPQAVYGVMQQCWQYDPEERPDFVTIHTMLQSALDTISN